MSNQVVSPPRQILQITHSQNRMGDQRQYSKIVLIINTYINCIIMIHVASYSYQIVKTIWIISTCNVFHSNLVYFIIFTQSQCLLVIFSCHSDTTVTMLWTPKRSYYLLHFRTKQKLFVFSKAMCICWTENTKYFLTLKDGKNNLRKLNLNHTDGDEA